MRVGSAFELSFVLAVALSISHWQLPALAGENMDKAVEAYKLGNYVEALGFIDAELKVNPKSVPAHYLFGNVLLTRKAFAEAAREYKKVAELSPNSVFGRLSKKELQRLVPAVAPARVPLVGTAPGAVAPGAVVPGAVVPGAVAPGGQPGTPAAADDRAGAGAGAAAARTGDADADAELEARRRAVKNTTLQTREQSLRKTDEFEKRISDVQRDADYKIKDLTEERNFLIEQNGVKLYLYGKVVYDPANANKAIETDYQSRITAVKEEAKKRTEVLQKAHADAQKIIEQSGLSVDHQLMTPASPTGFRVIPQGTDLHVRNYESGDEPSGHVVPMLAEPGRLKIEPTAAKTGQTSGKPQTLESAK